MGLQEGWLESADRGAQIIHHLWQEGNIAYRPDLEEEDSYGERSRLESVFGHAVRSVIDIPFSHGTLAVNSSEANAFSEEDIRDLQALASTLSEGFHRLEDLQKLEERNQELEGEIAERKRHEMQQQVLGNVREEVWKMKSSRDVKRILTVMHDGLLELGMSFDDCGVNLVDETSGPFSVQIRNLNENGEWVGISSTDRVTEMIVRAWSERRIVYRKDLQAEDLYGETGWFLQDEEVPIRSVIDIPFSHGTLAVNSSEANAFSELHIRDLQALAEVLSEGFLRLEDMQKLEEQNRELEAEVVERKQAEEEITKFKTISDRAGYGSAISDLEGNLIYINASFAGMHGYTVDELMGKNLSISHNEEQMEKVNRLKEQLKQEGSYVAEEVWHNQYITRC